MLYGSDSLWNLQIVCYRDKVIVYKYISLHLYNGNEILIKYLSLIGLAVVFYFLLHPPCFHHHH